MMIEVKMKVQSEDGHRINRWYDDGDSGGGWQNDWWAKEVTLACTPAISSSTKCALHQLTVKVSTMTDARAGRSGPLVLQVGDGSGDDEMRMKCLVPVRLVN